MSYFSIKVLLVTLVIFQLAEVITPSFLRRSLGERFKRQRSVSSHKVLLLFHSNNKSNWWVKTQFLLVKRRIPFYPAFWGKRNQLFLNKNVITQPRSKTVSEESGRGGRKSSLNGYHELDLEVKKFKNSRYKKKWQNYWVGKCLPLSFKQLLSHGWNVSSSKF